MKDSEPFNPYAPPQAELSTSAPEKSSKRPVSVKWAIVITLFSVIAIACMEYQLFFVHGWKLWTDSPWGTMQDALRLVSCLALIFGGRKPWVYWVTAVLLAWNLINLLKNVLGYSPAFPAHDIPSWISVSLGGLLMCFHFCHFAFGGPSRRYFQVARE